MANPLKILRGSKPVTNFDPDTRISLLYYKNNQGNMTN